MKAVVPKQKGLHLAPNLRLGEQQERRDGAQQKGVTMPESNRLAVCNTPRESVMVSNVAAQAPMQAAAVMPKLPTQASPPMDGIRAPSGRSSRRARRPRRCPAGTARPADCGTRPARWRPRARATRPRTTHLRCAAGGSARAPPRTARPASEQPVAARSRCCVVPMTRLPKLSSSVIATQHSSHTPKRRAAAASQRAAADCASRAAARSRRYPRETIGDRAHAISDPRSGPYDGIAHRGRGTSTSAARARRGSDPSRGARRDARALRRETKMTSGSWRTTYSGLSCGNATQIRRHDIACTEPRQQFTDERCRSCGIGRSVHLEIHARSSAAAPCLRLRADLLHRAGDCLVEALRPVRTPLESAPTVRTVWLMSGIAVGAERKAIRARVRAADR